MNTSKNMFDSSVLNIDIFKPILNDQTIVLPKYAETVILQLKNEILKIQKETLSKYEKRETKSMKLVKNLEINLTKNILKHIDKLKSVSTPSAFNIGALYALALKNNLDIKKHLNSIYLITCAMKNAYEDNAILQNLQMRLTHNRCKILSNDNRKFKVRHLKLKQTSMYPKRIKGLLKRCNQDLLKFLKEFPNNQDKEELSQIFDVNNSKNSNLILERYYLNFYDKFNAKSEQNRKYLKDIKDYVKSTKEEGVNSIVDCCNNNEVMDYIILKPDDVLKELSCDQNLEIPEDLIDVMKNGDAFDFNDLQVIDKWEAKEHIETKYEVDFDKNENEYPPKKKRRSRFGPKTEEELTEEKPQFQPTFVDEVEFDNDNVALIQKSTSTSAIKEPLIRDQDQVCKALLNLLNASLTEISQAYGKPNFKTIADKARDSWKCSKKGAKYDSIKSDFVANEHKDLIDKRFKVILEKIESKIPMVKPIVASRVPVIIEKPPKPIMTEEPLKYIVEKLSKPVAVEKSLKPIAIEKSSKPIAIEKSQLIKQEMTEEVKATEIPVVSNSFVEEEIVFEVPKYSEISLPVAKPGGLFKMNLNMKMPTQFQKENSSSDSEDESEDDEDGVVLDSFKEESHSNFQDVKIESETNDTSVDIDETKFDERNSFVELFNDNLTWEGRKIFVIDSGENPIPSTVKKYLEEKGSQLFDHSNYKQAGKDLYVLFLEGWKSFEQKRELLSGNISSITPSLLFLKNNSGVHFLSYDNLDDIVNFKCRILFPHSHSCLFLDHLALSNTHPENIRNLLEFIYDERLNSNRIWCLKIIGFVYEDMLNKIKDPETPEEESKKLQEIKELLEEYNKKLTDDQTMSLVEIQNQTGDLSELQNQLLNQQYCLQRKFRYFCVLTDNVVSTDLDIRLLTNHGVAVLQLNTFLTSKIGNYV